MAVTLAPIDSLPSNWTHTPLGSLVEVIRSGTYGAERSAPGLVPMSVATTAHISDDDGWNGNAMKCRYFTAEEVSRYSPRVGDLIVVKSSGSAASIKSGKVGLVTSREEGAFLFSNFLLLLRPRECSPEFIYYFLTSYAVKSKLPSLVEASTYPNLRLSEYLALEVHLPPLHEQRAIAEALRNVDALLGALDGLIAKKHAVKLGAMQQLLTGKCRLPGFQGEWEVASLQELVDRATGFWGAQSPDDGHPRYAEIIRAGDIAPDGTLTSTASRFLSEAEFSKAECRLDDLVITTSGNGLGKVWRCDGRANVAASNFVRVLRPIRLKAQGKFLSYVLRSGEALRQLQEHTATSAYPNLRTTFFSTSWIALPPVREQVAIANLLGDMDAELAALEQQREKTRALKLSMMQELLTGRTRLV